MEAFIDFEDGLDVEWEYVNCSAIVDPEKDLGGLYLGNRAASEDFPYFKAKNISVVVDMAGCKYKYPPNLIPHVLCIEAEDVDAYDLTEHFEKCFDFIHEHRKNGRGVLVHCMAGVSRSATIVIGYLMRYQNMDLKTAYQFVKKKRTCIGPNKGFIQQLMQYDKNVKVILEKELAAAKQKGKGKNQKK